MGRFPLFDAFGRHWKNQTRSTISTTSVQITPESVLNPLSIYSLARQGVEEKHTPEYHTPKYPSPESTPSDVGSAPMPPMPDLYPAPNISGTMQPFLGHMAEPAIMAMSRNSHLDGNLAVPTDQSLLWQTGLDDFSMSCLPSLDYSWQWAGTVQEGMDSRGFLPMGQWLDIRHGTWSKKYWSLHFDAVRIHALFRALRTSEKLDATLRFWIFDSLHIGVYE